MKNVNEIRKFVRQLVNESKAVISDGVSDIGSILGKVIGLITPGREAIDDGKLFGPEIGASSNEDMDASDKFVEGSLGNFNDETARDIDAIEKGVLAGLRMNARARQEGVAEGRAQVFAEMDAAGVDYAKFGMTAS